MTATPPGLVDGRFRLVDHFDRTVTEATYRGRWMLVFFGFTHCRMVCPRALAKLTRVLAQLGDAAGGIQPLYITVDPERDSPSVMRDFLQANYPRFTGLTGTPEQIDAAKKAFRVYSRRGGPGRSGRLPRTAFGDDVPSRPGRHVRRAFPGCRGC